MSIGEMSSRVTIEKCTDQNINENGFNEKTYATVLSCWARVKVINGKESNLSNTTVSKQQYKVTIRYYPNLDTSMRLILDNKVCDIISIDDISEKKRFTYIICEVTENA